MIAKSDWDAVHQQILDEERRRLGEPPTVDDMLAYGRGELSRGEEARVRERLVAWPDLAHALVCPFPDDGPTLSEEQLDEQWESLRDRFREPRVLPFEKAAQSPKHNIWRSVSAFAAAIAVVCGSLLWRAEMKLTEPRVAADEQLLLPDGQRGNGDASPAISPHGDSYLLIAPLINQPYFADYRVAIVDPVSTPSRVLWSSRAMPRRSSDTFAILVPRSFLPPGKYQVLLYGVRDGQEEQMASYTLRVQ